MRLKSMLLYAVPSLLVLCLAGCGAEVAVLIDKQGHPTSPPSTAVDEEIPEAVDARYPASQGWDAMLSSLFAGTENDEPGSDPILLAGPDPDGLGARYVFVDRDGRPVLEGDFVLCSPFSEGRAAVGPRVLPDGTLNPFRLTGYIDATGEFVIPPKYPSAGDFSEGRAWVEVDERFGYIDVDGELVIPPRYTTASDFSEGLACVIANTDKGPRWRYIDATGETVLELPETVARANVFSDGLAAVAVIDPARPDLGSKMGYIDRSGAFAIDPQFEDARAFSDGLAPAKRGDRWGYIDRQGAFVIEPHYLEAFPFEGDVAFVHVRKRVWPWQSDAWREWVHRIDWMRTDGINIR